MIKPFHAPFFTPIRKAFVVPPQYGFKSVKYQSSDTHDRIPIHPDITENILKILHVGENEFNKDLIFLPIQQNGIKLEGKVEYSELENADGDHEIFIKIPALSLNKLLELANPSLNKNFLDILATIISKADRDPIEYDPTGYLGAALHELRHIYQYTQLTRLITKSSDELSDETLRIGKKDIHKIVIAIISPGGPLGLVNEISALKLSGGIKNINNYRKLYTTFTLEEIQNFSPGEYYAIFSAQLRYTELKKLLIFHQGNHEAFDKVIRNNIIKLYNEEHEHFK
ncbi:hypothetical protein [Chromobacterium alticapitis]|uniref:hypothetical protein n=1 Tax=Chromobacterium alticapitis TaxID=2073169 RepID=UPI0011B091C0|nr:hypothetical protein [Chromobacterium alticapitis]